MANSDLVHALSRGLELLRLIAAAPEAMRLNDLAARSGLKKTTAYNLLRTLCAHKFAEKDDAGCYAVGPAFFELADKRIDTDRQEAARSAMLELAQRFPDHVITLAALKGSEVDCLLRISPELPGSVQRAAERRFMPYSSVSAIVIQAAYPQESQAMEAAYPFDEYGAGIWGDAANFDRVRDKALAERCCARVRNHLFTTAFVMPERHALGFSVRTDADPDMGSYRRAAEFFRRRVWRV